MIGNGPRAVLVAGVVAALPCAGPTQAMSCIERLHVLDEELDRDGLSPHHQLQIEVTIARAMVAAERGDLAVCRNVAAEVEHLMALRQPWQGEVEDLPFDMARLRQILIGWGEIQSAAAQQRGSEPAAGEPPPEPATSPPGLSHAIETAERALLEQNLATAQAALSIARQIEQGARDSGHEIGAVMTERLARLEEEIEGLEPIQEPVAPEQPETEAAAPAPALGPDEALREEIAQASAALQRELAGQAERLEQLVTAPDAAPAEAGPCGASVSVESGETLYGIARRCGTTVDAILRANPQIEDPQRLQIGQLLQLPDGGAAEPAQVQSARVEATPAAAPDGEAAALDEEAAAPGEEPAAPDKAPAAAATYTIEPGDTLYGIADRFGTGVEQLLALNPEIEDPGLIQPGRQIAVPGGD